jgi:hypothetical protein
MTHSTVSHARPATDTAAAPANRQFGTGVIVGALASLAVVAFTLGARLPSVPAGPMESRSYTHSLDGASQAAIRLQFGAGTLTVGALDTGDTNLAKVTYEGPSALLPEPSYGVRDGVGELAYRVRDTRPVWLPFVDRSEEHGRLDVQLARGAPVTLAIDAGGVESRLDLSALQISRLDLQTGVANTRVRLPEAASRTAVSVKGGVTDVLLDVPPGVAADIQVSDGLAGRQIDERRFRPMGGGHYRSAAYETAPNRVDMQIELGLANLTIQ